MAGIPKISVVICTYNREKFIGRALETLTAQTLSPDKYEILIIDNNSTDNTGIICREFINKHQLFNIKYLFEPNKGLSFARNRGIAEASSPIITYVDDDTEASPGFLENILNFFEAHPGTVGIGGKVIPVYPETGEPAWMNKYLHGFIGLVDYGHEPTLYQRPMKYPAGCNMTYTKEILQKAGGFNNQLTFRSDDKHIFYQVKKFSSSIYYLPGAMVHHNIDRQRLGFDNFRKLFLKTGNEEKRRVKSESGMAGVIKKFLEFSLKLGASLLLYIKFLVSGQELKGRYVVYSQWFTFRGFFMKEVFVR